MKTPKSLRYEYVEKIFEIFPYTIFQFTFEKDNVINWSKKLSFNYIDKFTFFKKESYFRSNLWNEYSDEIRLDFDYETLEENIYGMRGVVETLENLKIIKYETYLTGGKGTHLTFRFDFRPFKEFSREQVRNIIFNMLNLNINVDKSLFQTIQVIGLEGFNHRKTNFPKQRIRFEKEKYIILNANINFKYLEDSYINYLSKSLEDKVLDNLKEKPLKLSNFNLDIKKTNYDQNKLIWHISRFREIYLKLNDGKKRLLDMLTRYLILTTKNLEDTKIILESFSKDLNLNFNIESRIKSTKDSMKANAIFIYPNILTKEEFYKGWSMTNINEPLQNKK